MTYFTLTLKNSLGCDLGTEYFKHRQDLMVYLTYLLDIIESGDTLEFGEVEKD
jgi:hypothetical protein